MRLEIDGKRVHVFLSERNLRSLLVKLNGFPANSACTLKYQMKDGTLLVVTAELDSVHYAHPERDAPPPGPMHETTEAALTRE